jgi:hypothetical protein
MDFRLTLSRTDVMMMDPPLKVEVGRKEPIRLGQSAG